MNWTTTTATASTASLHILIVCLSYYATMTFLGSQQNETLLSAVKLGAASCVLGFLAVMTAFVYKHIGRSLARAGGVVTILSVIAGFAWVYAFCLWE